MEGIAAALRLTRFMGEEPPKANGLNESNPARAGLHFMLASGAPVSQSSGASRGRIPVKIGSMVPFRGFWNRGCGPIHCVLIHLSKATKGPVSGALCHVWIWGKLGESVDFGLRFGVYLRLFTLSLRDLPALNAGIRLAGMVMATPV